MAFPDAYDTALLAVSGLQTYWPMDDPSGGTLSAGSHYFREASGNFVSDTHLWFPYDGTYWSAGNASIVPSTSSPCIRHTGLNSSQLAWSSLTGAEQTALAQPGPLTCCFWIQPETILGDVNGNWQVFGEWSGFNAGAIYENLTTSQVGTITQRVAVPFNTIFVAHVYDRVHASIYVNGIQLAQIAATAAVTYSTFNVELGALLLNTAYFKGYVQKLAWFSTALSQSTLQSLYMTGAATTAEVAGANLNVYPWSRQAIASNGSRKSITLQNASDTIMFASLGSSAAVAQQGIYIPANGGTWSSSTWKGAIQVLHASPLGTKLLLVQEV